MRPPLPTLAILTALLTAFAFPAAGAAQAGPDHGLVIVESAASFEATYDRLRSAIEANPNLRILAEVDHGANAAGVDRALPPTRLILFGNPKLGTPLMQGARTVAIDLPQKVLVWEDGDGVHVAYNHPDYLAARHGIDGRDRILETIAGALSGLVEAAARP
jgi:uncharacterized protein (DUF302 family)